MTHHDLRRAVDADVPGIERLVADAFGPYVERIGRPPAPMTQDYRALLTTARVWVADGPDGVALTTWMPPAWWGLGWEVHDAPTRWGRLSYAVRWHGGRPALLWERGEPLPGLAGDPVLTAPGLDPSWSTGESRGEALLAAVPPPEGVDVGPDVATGGVAVAAPPRSVWRPQDPGPDAPSDVASERPVPPPPAPDGGPGDSFL